jgi:SAM-dependent methyltransferase
MDQTLRGHIKAHYDAHAAQVPTHTERNAGPAAPLKKFHNAVKRALLRHVLKPGARLLDLGSGRGGDVRKWADCGARFAKGLDISEAELQEAARRAQGLRVRCVFEATEDLGLRAWADPDGPYDVVSCMFALHYFFASEAMAQTFLKHVATNLRPGGYFVGVVPDGVRVNQTLASGDTGEALHLRALWHGPPQAFGSAYVCSIADTVTDKGGSYEYLVYENVLVALAAQVGLHPVTDLRHQGLEDTTGTFKHLVPPYRGPLATATHLFAAFVFQKM